VKNTTFNAEAAEAAAKKLEGILRDLCVLCVKRCDLFTGSTGHGPRDDEARSLKADDYR